MSVLQYDHLPVIALNAVKFQQKSFKTMGGVADTRFFLHGH